MNAVSDMKCDFGTVSERDMDMLFLNAFSTDKDFVDLFLVKAGVSTSDYIVSEVYLSKADKDGESDITVILESTKDRIALLIEDKIDAIAMPEQPERYIKRGNKGTKKGDYEEFYSFIVCPKKYYDNNDTAKRYPYVVLYEEIRDLFSVKKDPAHSVYFQEICQAIEKAKRPPKVEVDENANRFFRKYKDYQEQHYPELNLTTNRNANGYWAHYTTRFGTVYLYHKIGDGKVDLTFNRAGNHLDKLEIVAKWLNEHNIAKVIAVKTGMAGALRVNVPKLNMQIPFDENDEYDIEVCFKIINDLIEAANTFGVASSISDLLKSD